VEQDAKALGQGLVALGSCRHTERRDDGDKEKKGSHGRRRRFLMFSVTLFFLVLRAAGCCEFLCQVGR
jgi:hypothetical protein